MRGSLWRALVPVRHLRVFSCGMSTASGSSSASALEWLDQFVNYEKKGVPKAAGTDTEDGFDLGRMRRLLARLGDPQRRWAAVHVAGTKGKGSVTTIIANILTQANYEVGTYTSPHVASFYERIAVDGVPISPAAFADMVSRHRPVIEAAQQEEGGALSHFEITTALAYKHFEEQEVDMAVVEVGLGGGRDATNVLEADSVRVAVVTAIGLDHQDALGEGVEAVASAKAGIIKEGRPVVIAKQTYPDAERVLRERAALLGAPVVLASEEVQFEDWGPEFVPGEGFRDGTEMNLEGHTVSSLLDPFMPSHCDVTMRLLGKHQGVNAAAAIAAAAVLKRQGFHRINMQSVVEGLANAAMPGRFQICRFAPSAAQPAAAAAPTEAAAAAAAAAGDPGSLDDLDAAVLGLGGSSSSSSSAAQLRKQVCGVPASPGDPWVVLDGAHTPESAAAVAATLREVFPSSPLAFVVAMADDKQHTEFMAELRRTSPNVVVFTEVPIAGGRTRSAAPGALAGAWQAAATLAPKRPGGTRTRELIQASLVAAVEKARSELAAQQGQGVLCVTGSFHAVGAALRQLDLVHC